MNRKQNASLKMQIVIKFILSATGAMLASFVVIFGGIVLLEHAWHEKYDAFITWYNSDYTAGAIFLLGTSAILIAFTFIFFLCSMNTITSEIARISDVIHLLSDGKLDNRITNISNNELGKLASDVNAMAESLQMSMKKEKQWNEERYNLITNMSHDLKTPMMSVMGYADRIKKKKYKNEQELEEYCDIIFHKTEELNVVVKQLFEFSKFSSSSYPLQKQEIPVMQFAEQVAMTFIPQLDAAQLELHLKLSPDMTVMADMNALKSVFENLISNAIKYAADGKNLDICEVQSGEKREIIFRNYGSKIDEDDIDKLFEKFYREKKNDGIEGSGCGLFIVRQIMQLHGGEIYITSSEQCTEFHLTFPNEKE